MPPLSPSPQLSLFGSEERVLPRPEAFPSREEALALARAGAYDPPPGVRYELDAWVLVSSASADGPAG